ncbi:hypothetical protein KKF34_10880 [Myxococcota bacterium]|nr:hypothetical protein [Myxococcota bacterium]MBU1382806.1 hypothetical protein [Myxococcota bacterium]MBU1497371.1 hypothetical protein [Myxococcota bacterium]
MGYTKNYTNVFMYRNVHLIFALITIYYICCYFPGVVQAQSVTFDGRFGAGSGFTTGKTDTSHTKRSPAFVSADIRARFDDEDFPVYALEINVELESRTTLGLVPKIEYTAKMGDYMGFTIYGGAHVKISEYNLFGPEVGVLFHTDLGKIVVHLKLSLGIFLWGSDLPENTTISKIDLSIGFSFPITRYGQ